MDEAIAHVGSGEDGAFEVRVNFGILAGRNATPAELEELGRRLVQAAGDVAVVSEDRFELSRHSEAEVHQVRIELEDAEDLDVAMRARVVATAERWARTCAAERHIDVADS